MRAPIGGLCEYWENKDPAGIVVRTHRNASAFRMVVFIMFFSMFLF
jgi:hypothetical protein